MKALEIAQGMEATETNMKKLQGSEPTPVNLMQQSTRKPDPTKGGRWRPPDLAENQEKDKSSRKPCFHCGMAGHSQSKCRYCEVVCRKCHKTGHLAKVCRNKQPPVPARPVNTVTDCSPEKEAEFTLFTVGPKRNSPITVTLHIDGCPLDMEVDTGATVSVIPISMKEKYFQTVVLEASDIILTTYTGEQIPVVGKIPVNVQYKDQTKNLYLYVVKRDRSCLMGRDWLAEIRLH